MRNAASGTSSVLELVGSFLYFFFFLERFLLCFFIPEPAEGMQLLGSGVAAPLPHSLAVAQHLLHDRWCDSEMPQIALFLTAEVTALRPS